MSTIDQVVIGSCTNGRIDDMRAAAEILKGRKVNPKVCAAIIIPATQEVYLQCIEEGLTGDLHRGWLLSFPRRPAARAWADHMGILAHGEKRGCHHQPQLCRPYGSCGLGSLSGKPGRGCRQRGSRRISAHPDDLK